MAYVAVIVINPWMREVGGKTRRYHPGMRALLTSEEYRRSHGLDYIAREFVPAVHWSGRAYYHAVTCDGRLIGSPQRRPTIRMEDSKPLPPIEAAIVSPSPRTRVIRFEPKPGVVRRGCGCRGLT